MPPLKVSARVQVGEGATEHVQPEPPIETSETALGRFSVTVTGPLLAPALEPLLTVTVYVAPA